MEVVTFEIAKKLKEKGFRKPCILYYNSDEVRTWFNEPWIAKNFTPTTLGNDDVLAPTISQVLKWLREECGIFILVEPDILSPKYKLTFTIRVKFYIKGEEDEGLSEKYLTYRRDSYEHAALAGIEYCLDNLI